MAEQHQQTPAERSRHRLKLLTGTYVAVLAVVVVTLPVWLAHVPEPAALRPVPTPGPPVATFDVTTLPVPPGAPPARDTPLSRAAQQRQRGDKPSETDSPVVERRWSQGAAAPAIADPARSLGLPADVMAGGRLDRSPEARRRRVRQFGGTTRTEDAVEAGLAWLAAHQDQDGTWDRFQFARHCPQDNPCPGAAVRWKNDSFRPGLTALTLLAFLGAGYTDRDGPYRDAVARSVNALLDAQMPSGGFGRDEALAGYNDALAAFALAEYCALTGEPRIVAPLERAVTRLVLSQQELGGWDYLPRPDSGRNDTSITGWAVQALQACAAAGIHVPRRVLIKAALHFARASEPDGRVRYADAGTGFKIDETTLELIYRYGPAMTAVGLTCEQLIGWRLDSALLGRQQALLTQQLPSAALLQGRDPTRLHSYYYWYYGTVAAFQAGGERWERWNGRLRDAILPLQDRSSAAGRRPHSYGSWPPFGPNWGKWGRIGGRVYTTAICVLTLEIYYRHTPAYLEDHLVLDSSDWQAFLKDADQRERRAAVQVLREMRVEIAEPVLVGLLRDGDRSLALRAAVALTAFDSPLGRPLLEEAVDTLPPWDRESVAQALRRTRQIEALPPVRGTVRVFDAARRLATVELPRAYVGMVLSIRRDGRFIAQLRVIKRFSGIHIVVAETLREPRGDPPQPGDVATGS